MDTGAQINLIKRSFPLNKDVVVSSGIIIKGINGKSLTYGGVKLSFCVGEAVIEDDFHIVDDSCLGNFDMYLGSKFFLDNGCIIDHENLTVQARSFTCKMFIDQFGFQQSAEINEISVAIDAINDKINEVESTKSTLDSESIKERFHLGHLQGDTLQSIAIVLNSYNDVFEDLMADDLPDLTFDSLQLTTDKYIQAAIYRTPPVHNKVIEEEMKRLLELKIISHSKSPFNSPVWIVPKKGGENGEQLYRIVIDYRKLNKVTIQDNYPLPRIEDIIDQLGGARHFSVMDLVSGFHQIALKEEDKYKTAFSVRGAHYEFNRLPFGLINSAPAFQRLMTQVLEGLIGRICFVYIDDIVVYGRSIEEHNMNVDTVLKRLSLNKLKIKPSKCHFLKNEIKYLGFLISDGGYKMDPNKTEAIRNFVPPQEQKQLKSFLGLISFYRKYIPSFSLIAQPLHRLLRKDVIFEWSAECKFAFDKLIEAVEKNIILKYPDFSKEFYLTTDASNFGLGAVLSQRGDDGTDRPLAFISRSLNPAEQNYSTTEKECLAIVWAIHDFRHYLIGRKFTIFSDHRPLVWLDNVADPGARLLRWRLKLNNYNYEIKFTPGRTNFVADEFSRNGYCNFVDKPFAEEVILPLVSAVDVLVDGVVKDDEEEDDHEVIDFYPRKERIKITDVSIISELIKEQHCGPIGGHRGITATTNAINIYYEILNLKQQVTEFIKSCDICQRVKINRQHRVLPLTLTATPSQPNEKIAFDVIGPFKYPNKGKLWGLTIQDEFSKYIMFVGIRDCMAETVARALVEVWILNYGIPKILLSDNGSNLCGEIMTEIANYFNIKRITTSIAHPQSNGSVERAHARLAEFIRATEKEVEEDVSWESKLKMASYCYNTTVHSTTGFTPYYLMFGRHPRLITSIGQPLNLIPDTYLEKFNSNIKMIWDAARSNIERKKLKAIETQNKTVKARKVEVFEVGDFIMLDAHVERGNLDKLVDSAFGPYKVLEVRETNLLIRKRRKQVIVNKSNCSKYKGDTRNLY